MLRRTEYLLHWRGAWAHCRDRLLGCPPEARPPTPLQRTRRTNSALCPTERGVLGNFSSRFCPRRAGLRLLLRLLIPAAQIARCLALGSWTAYSNRGRALSTCYRGICG